MGCRTGLFPVRKLLRLFLSILVVLVFLYAALIYGFLKAEHEAHSSVSGNSVKWTLGQKERKVSITSKVDQFLLPKVNTSLLGFHHKPQPPNMTFVYFTIPKCGSRTLYYLVSNLKEKNGWREVSALTKLVKERRRDRTHMVQEYVDNATQSAFLYVDTSFVPLYNIPNLVYISLIRDPLERFLSAYYFEKSGDSIQGPDSGLKGKYGRDYFSRCQKSHRNDTCFGHWLGKTIHPRFCGISTHCSQMARKTIERAKKIASSTFSIVGVLEEFEKFLKLLEAKYPAHFAGIVELYQSSETQGFVSKFKTKEKERPRPDIIEKMKVDMKLDYEFYEYVKNHFHEQLNQMNIQ